MQVRSLAQEDPLEEGMSTHSSVLAWRLPWTEEPGQPQTRNRKESGTTKATQHVKQPREAVGEEEETAASMWGPHGQPESKCQEILFWLEEEEDEKQHFWGVQKNCSGMKKDESYFSHFFSQVFVPR